MKAIVNGKDIPKERPFPKLMICTSPYNQGMIVLFETQSRGTVITESENWKMANHCSAFDMDVFKDFEGSITLSND